MFSSKATADAIAARFVGLTATSEGQTEALVNAPTASLPDQVTTGPTILVFHPTGVLDLAMSRIRDDELDFPVRMLRDPVGYPRRSDWLYAWYDAMRDIVEADMDLGLPYVAWARCTAMEAELDGAVYADAYFDLVELTVRVHYHEVVTTAAI
jgi:hypothetical protein